MSRKKSPEGHPSLFVITEGQQPSILSWQDIESSPAHQVQAVQSGEIGPHVSVVERAEHLVRAMNALAHRNMLRGFDVAAHDGRYKTPIWKRYMDGTPRVIDNSMSKVERLQREAEDHFWHATGFSALKGTGITRGEVRTRLDKMWRDFHDGKADKPGVGASANHKELARVRNNQKKFLPKDHELRQKKTKSKTEGRELAA